MLVLKRKAQEKVILSVGTVRIEVMVVDVNRGRVRLGFECPPEVLVMREELEEWKAGAT